MRISPALQDSSAPGPVSAHRSWPLRHPLHQFLRHHRSLRHPHCAGTASSRNPNNAMTEISCRLMDVLSHASKSWVISATGNHPFVSRCAGTPCAFPRNSAMTGTFPMETAAPASASRSLPRLPRNLPLPLIPPHSRKSLSAGTVSPIRARSVMMGTFSTGTAAIISASSNFSYPPPQFPRLLRFPHLLLLRLSLKCQ